MTWLQKDRLSENSCSGSTSKRAALEVAQRGLAIHASSGDWCVLQSSGWVECAGQGACQSWIRRQTPNSFTAGRAGSVGSIEIFFWSVSRQTNSSSSQRSFSHYQFIMNRFSNNDDSIRHKRHCAATLTSFRLNHGHGDQKNIRNQKCEQNEIGLHRSEKLCRGCVRRWIISTRTHEKWQNFVPVCPKVCKGSTYTQYINWIQYGNSKWWRLICRMNETTVRQYKFVLSFSFIQSYW